MNRMRLVAYFVYIDAVPGAYGLPDRGFLVPRRVYRRIVRFDWEKR